VRSKLCHSHHRCGWPLCVFVGAGNERVVGKTRLGDGFVYEDPSALAGQFYTKEGGQRRYFDLLPPGRLPGQQPAVDQTVGVANGGGATLRQRQEGSSLSQQQTANSSSVGRRTGTLPSGAQYEVVQEGTGRVPTPNDRVKFDDIEWVDGFNGRDKFVDYRGRVDRVSDLFFAWEGDAVLSMREGETRQITLPPGYIARYIQLRLISIE